jgi:predicted peroxiredoxin
MKSAWGSDDPTKAAFPFLHGHALAEAGHSVQIFLLGEAVSLMRLSNGRTALSRNESGTGMRLAGLVSLLAEI